MYVVITDKKTGKIYRIGPIHLSGGNYTPTEKEYFMEAWRTACEDGLADPQTYANYTFVLA